MRKTTKVLWLTNICMPDVAKEFNKDKSFAGGWLAGLFSGLKDQDNISLCVCFPLYGQDLTQKVVKDNISYYGVGVPSIPYQYSENAENSFKKILKDETPDLVHIFGTEFAHTLAMVNAFNNPEKTVISIQGLCSVYANHYLEGIKKKVIDNRSIVDLIKNRGLKSEKDDYIKRGELEIKALEKVNHVIGRTSWDKACTLKINDKANYHFCNESLRESFYHNSWNIKNIEKYSILVSQGSYPIKGLHYMIEALFIIVKNYKDAKLYIAGGKILDDNNSFISNMKMASYPRYIKSLIAKFNLDDNIEFVGNLNENQMCEKFLKTHVFVSPSTIENSPNSVGEAMLLGVPTVSSDVGGVLDLMNHKTEGFVYQSSASYMLAHYVQKLFNEDELCIEFSKRSQAHAKITHNKKINTNALTDIYLKIAKEGY